MTLKNFWSGSSHEQHFCDSQYVAHFSNDKWFFSTQCQSDFSQNFLSIIWFLPSSYLSIIRKMNLLTLLNRYWVFSMHYNEWSIFNHGFEIFTEKKSYRYLYPPKHELLYQLLIKSLNQPYYLVDCTKNFSQNHTVQ